jgi:hypothetical protein
LVSKEYKGNSAEISNIYIYIYIYIYKLVTTNTYHIFWIYNLRLLQRCWNNREVDQESREDYKLD